jgi:hypothetical protein
MALVVERGSWRGAANARRRRVERARRRWMIGRTAPKLCDVLSLCAPKQSFMLS